MPFDQPTRNRLARFVADARSLLSEEFTRQLQHEYGLDPASGDVAELAKLGHLDDARRETARILRATLAHYLAGAPKADKKARQETLQRIVREQAYTVLNRLAALRMAEARGLLIEGVARGCQSRGFQLYAHLAGPALGETGAAYRSFLFSLFDELAVELPALFDRYNPQGRLFPRESALLRLLDLLNAPDLEALWGEDETIGWIYQYFNSGEERRQMRAESQAPRNSRELAVRNQFFTPRYVVEFLTDNTLGRIWYEMTQGRTQLTETCRYLVRRPNEVFLAAGEEVNGERLTVNGADGEALSQDELLQQPVYIPYRPLKDPREITMLDPACGSMHFGLYAFDLFERIYEEAWEMEASGYALRVTHHAPLHADFATKEALRRAIPRLIIEHNIHGIDIDPRAVQIAGLSLWLRAQRSWQAQRLRPQERPAITRSHIVCAEPMPGEAALLEEFLAGLRADRLEGLIRRVLDVPAGQQVRATARMAGALCDLVRTVWQEMRLAGEAGSLLKIEETLANAVAAAEREWSERMPLFRVVEFGMTGEAERVRYPRGVPGQEGADFWQQAEALVLAALHDYAEQAQNGAGYQRRLFASDAARGFAFVDVCRKRYDAVLMNPPFGLSTRAVFDQLRGWYRDTYVDLYACFGSRAIGFAPNGIVGAITSRAFQMTKKLARWRSSQLVGSIELILDLGLGVMDEAFVEAAAYTIRPLQASASMVAFDRRNNTAKDSPPSLVDDENLYIVLRDEIRSLPGHKLLYQLPSSIFHLLRDTNVFEPLIGTAREGLRTFDDFRFVRLRWEIPQFFIGPTRTWEPFAKGGKYAEYYSDIHLLVKWNRTGEELAEKNRQVNGQVAQARQASEFYRLAGATYSKRSAKGFSARALPAGCIIGTKGPAVLSNSTVEPSYLVGWLNSNLVVGLIHIQANAYEFNTGIIKRLPWRVPANLEHLERLAALSIISIRDQRRLWETNSCFIAPLLANSLAEATFARRALREETFRISQYCKSIWDSSMAEVYGVSEIQSVNADEETTEPEDEDYDDDESQPLEEPQEEAIVLISYALGTAYGRWDIRFSVSERDSPQLPDPFAPLPICPPGMLQNAHGLPAAPADVPADYPLRISWPGILVDDPGHPEDIEARGRDALRVIWPDNADSIEQEACQILGVGSLREYFASPNRFFDDHLKRYSKSRRQAPIYWPLSTASGSYTLWLYYHRLSDQTLYWCVNDFVEPRLKVIGDQLSAIRRKASRSRDEERELERLSQFEAELRELRDELLRAAAFWRPNLNDGVQITAAPLWRLFRHRAWQRRLRETWEQLEAGAYDWAHLALSIWPARVVPKCVTDRSLAIAHDLEELFWVEDPPGSWRTLRAPDEELAGLVAAQQSPARARLAVLLAELARGRARGLRCAEVWDELAAGRWDDLEAALLLWPARVAEACWDDPLLAVTLQIALPTKRTKAARDRFVKERVAAGCPDLAAALEAALRQRPDRFTSFWSELARGDHDHLRLALALWPARVVEKCAVDVELADGHDVRRFLWVRREDVWRRRKVIEQEVADEAALQYGK